MKRSVLSWVMIVGLGLGIVAERASADASPIATSMGDLRWGMSEREVAGYAKRELASEYSAALSKTKDAGQQSKLKNDLKAAQSEVDKSTFSFTGGKSRWDSSPIAGEFSYDNQESMMMSKDISGTTYYFFLDGKLWKYVRILDKKAAGGDFKKFSKYIEDKFGKGREKKGEVTPGQGDTHWLEYLDRNSRMRAADDNGKRGGYAMIFEEMATVRQLASTRPQKPARLAGASDDDPPAEPKKTESEAVAKAKVQRSVFQQDQRSETPNEFESRKQKAAREAQERASRAAARKEEAKKGEALKQLDGLSDSDPLGGL
jgi:hypothetical protein